jgi:NADH:ubiquinone oxidoreductase subunit 6 (subunit J)
MISELVLNIVGAGLIVSACLAIFLDEAVYSVGALAGTFFLTSLLYALDGAVFVAVFHFAVGIGTLAILFLSGEMLSEKPLLRTKPNRMMLVVVTGVVLSFPAVFLSISSPNKTTDAIGFGDALWNLRALDVVLQGLVIFTVALGIAVVLYQKKLKSKKESGGK